MSLKSRFTAGWAHLHSTCLQQAGRALQASAPSQQQLALKQAHDYGSSLDDVRPSGAPSRVPCATSAGSYVDVEVVGEGLVVGAGGKGTGTGGGEPPGAGAGAAGGGPAGGGDAVVAAAGGGDTCGAGAGAGAGACGGEESCGGLAVGGGCGMFGGGPAIPIVDGPPCAAASWPSPLPPPFLPPSTTPSVTAPATSSSTMPPAR